MENKQKAYTFQHRQQPFSPGKRQKQLIRTVKSPSPDKQNSYIIPNTPSPEINKNCAVLSGRKEPIATTICKRIGQRERNYQHYVEGSEDKQQMAWIANLSSQMNGRRTTLKNVDDTRRSERNSQRRGLWDVEMYEKSYTPSQLDYLRIIREKQQTIKQLREILQQMDKNSIINHPVDQEKLKKAEKKIKEYQKQIKVLQIQNQCLINVIQSNHVNLPSNKEAILQREIIQLRESLKLKQEQIEQTRHCSESASEKLLHLQLSNKQLLQENQELEGQCQKLIKLMKEKIDLQKPKNDFGGSSELKRGQKLTLNLIKQQYSQNLALMKSNFKAEVEKATQNYQNSLQKTNNKIDQLLRRIKAFEEKKQMIFKKIGQVSSSIKVNKKQQSLEIQFLLQKYQKTEKDLQHQKSINQKLNSQLQTVQQNLKSFQMRSFQMSQLLEGTDRILKEKEANILSQTKNSLTVQITKLNEENQELKSKLNEAEKSFQQKLSTVIMCYENQLQDRRNTIEEKIKELQQNYLSELDGLKVINQQMQMENNQLLRQRQQWNDQYKKFSELFEKEIKDKNVLIQQLQRQLQRVDQKAKQKRQQKELKMNQMDLSIITQLSKLKEDFQILNTKLAEQDKIICQHQLLQVQFQLKVQQNHRLFIEIDSLKQDISRRHKEHCRLSQKIVSLQKTVSFHDQELRERKLIYQQLYIDKNKLQKSSFLAQKLKLANKDFHSNKQPLSQMLKLIERLLQAEKQHKLKISLIQQQ